MLSQSILQALKEDPHREGTVVFLQRVQGLSPQFAQCEPSGHSDHGTVTQHFLRHQKSHALDWQDAGMEEREVET